MSPKRDYYEVLDLGRDASQDEIKKAYRRLAREFHPDVNDSDGAEERFKEINEAYEVLSDPQTRRMYDRFGHRGVEGVGRAGAQDFGGFTTIEDIFDEFFGFGQRTRGRRRDAPQRGSDLKINVTLSFEEAAFGCEKAIELPRWETCPDCDGSGAQPGTRPSRCPQCNGAGEVRQKQQSIFGSFVSVSTCSRCQGRGEVITTPCKECGGRGRVQRTRKLNVEIPAGVDDGTQIRLGGEGEAGEHGGPAGNLYVQISVEPHPYFKRREHDIHLELPINIAQATLGTETEVPTLNGDVTLTIPAGTQTGETFRLRSKGVPYLRRQGRGDQWVTVYVVTPTDLTEEQEELFHELAETLGDEVIPQGQRSFFDRIRDAFTGG